ncbi:cytochrome P450 [Streptacidiphilus cavernicola]|uniref:Cytochrome P450 n=1 Tax=Streptacidiphilus cavernicola TaxID=3342716 RepID=A0ABV6W438_9ACTN
MTVPPPEQTGADPAQPAVPPPGCPAHGLGSDAIRRLYGPEAEADPMGLYEKLRAEHGTVAPVLVHGDLPAWLVLGHRENLDVARTPSRFSRDPRRWRDMQEGRVGPAHPLAPIAAWQPLCNFVDGKEHERLRGAVNDGLARFDRRGVRRHVTRFANQLIDEFAPVGQAELVGQFAAHLPMLVMTQLLGMPEEYGPRLVEAARDMMKGTPTALASNDYIVGTLRQLVERRRAEPGEDFASWLIAHSSALSDNEVVEHLRLVLITAFETTANLIANTLRMVLTDRRFRASLAGGRMTLPDALEQVLWDEPPLTTILGRWATGDTELGDQRIKAGDLLLLGLAAGNVDPAIRPDPTVPVHGNRSHLAFSGGPHECPGQDIGRAIADTGIDTLLMRLPDLRLAVPETELRWVSTLMSRHLVALPVEFTPGRPKQTGPAASATTAATAAATADAASAPATAATDRAEPPRRTGWWSGLTRLLTRRSR